jgi:hypothetical protein
VEFVLVFATTRVIPSLHVQSVYKFLNNKAKPVILAMSRPDAKKNIVTLVRAFGENSTLREIANLVLVMGNRTKIDNLAYGSQQVLTTVLKLIDEYDLYGSVAYPKAHTQVRLLTMTTLIIVFRLAGISGQMSGKALSTASVQKRDGERSRACQAGRGVPCGECMPAHM